MSLGNPVLGTILANKQPWPGTPKFRVTATFQQHTGRALGIDIGNGRCGDPVLAMADGTVSFSGKLGLALVVRIDHPLLGRRHQTGYAHLSSTVVKVGQVVRKGQRIGSLGKTGADACHLHAGYTINGVEQDWWPWLEQNIEVEVDTVQARYPVPRPYAAKGGPLTGYSPTTAPKTVNYSAGSPFTSLAAVTVTPTPTDWAAGPYQLIGNRELKGYYVPDASLIAGPVPPTYTQAQLDAAVDKAEADAAQAASRDVAEAAVDEAIKYGGKP